MSLARLRKLLPVPANPRYCCSNGEIQRAEEALGVKLPRDYKALVQTYGSGCVDTFLWLFNPCTKNPHLSLLHRAPRECKAARQMYEELGKPCPYVLYPDKHGLLPWAVSDNADLVYFRLHKPFVVVVEPRQHTEWHEFDTSITNFLGDALDGKLRIPGFPDDWPDPQHTFTPDDYR